jgi:predicted porin
MNNTIKLAVASALLAAASSASAAGGIVAGDWTLDIGGVVNAYYTNTKVKGEANGTHFGGATSTGTSTVSNITTGLLPNYLAVSGKTRQNDLDVAFTISINPGASTSNAGIQSAQQENRQAFLTFGDASWGSIKLGKDLGIYASDAILNDMTLLGVGSGAGHLTGNTTTLGRIGTGFMYADWKAQVAYTSPNFNGFQFTAGVTQAFGVNPTLTNVADDPRGGKEPAFEGKASYSFAADAVTGKVWASAISQNVEAVGKTSSAWDLGANVNAAGFGLTGYYGEGRGMGTALQFNGAYDDNGAKRKSDDWYVQASYALPGVGTKLAASYGESTLKAAADDSDLAGNLVDSMWVVGVYHPITKHLNLVAEYSDAETTVKGADSKGTAKTMSLGAILFF